MPYDFNIYHSIVSPSIPDYDTVSVVTTADLNNYATIPYVNNFGDSKYLSLQGGSLSGDLSLDNQGGIAKNLILYSADGIPVSIRAGITFVSSLCSETGIVLPGLLITDGRLDITPDPTFNRAEFRIRGNETQFNIVNINTFDYYMRVNTDTSAMFGSNTYALSSGAFATGVGASAVNTGAHAEGDNTTASGEASHAEGFLTIASGINSHAEGNITTAFGNYSHAEGSNTTASGEASHAEGNSFASGSYSHAEGFITNASGSYSHAEGTNTEASGTASHAEGFNTTASGNNSHAEGANTTASGEASHAAGVRVTAAQDYTYAWSDGNLGTLTQNISTTRAGQYMVSASGGMFIPGNVGIGTDSIANALTVVGDISATSTVYSSGAPVVVSSSQFETPTTNISAINNIVALTQTAYDNLSIKLPTTLYVIV